MPVRAGASGLGAVAKAGDLSEAEGRLIFRGAASQPMRSPSTVSARGLLGAATGSTCHRINERSGRWATSDDGHRRRPKV
jgi:hypothetical protein